MMLARHVLVGEHNLLVGIPQLLDGHAHGVLALAHQLGRHVGQNLLGLLQALDLPGERREHVVRVGPMMALGRLVHAEADGEGDNDDGHDNHHVGHRAAHFLGHLGRRDDGQHNAEQAGQKTKAGHKPRAHVAAGHLEQARTVRLVVAQLQERDEHEHVIHHVEDGDGLGDEHDKALDVRDEEAQEGNKGHERHLQIHKAARHAVLIGVLQHLRQKAGTSGLAEHERGTCHVGDERRHGSAEADPHEGHVNPRAVEGGAEDLIGLVQAVDQVHVGFRRDDGDAHGTGDEDDQRQDHGDEDGQREFLLRLLQLLDVGGVHIDAREAEEHAGGQGQVGEAEAVSEGIERLGRGGHVGHVALGEPHHREDDDERQRDERADDDAVLGQAGEGLHALGGQEGQAPVVGQPRQNDEELVLRMVHELHSPVPIRRIEADGGRG